MLKNLYSTVLPKLSGHVKFMHSPVQLNNQEVTKLAASLVYNFNKNGTNSQSNQPPPRKKCSELFTQSSSVEKFQYKLPTLEHGLTYKRTILDPIAVPQFYKLPTLISVHKEKVSPTWQKIVPVEAPSTESLCFEKIANPQLIIIRRKKMKKHHLKRFRKKMLYVHRAQTAKNNKKKELIMRNYEKEMNNLAEKFDAEKFVNSQMEEAKKGGYSVDVLSDWLKKNQNESRSNH